MASHVSHIGVHDHGFNNVSTYGNLRRLMLEGRIPHNQAELDFYEIALKTSGAVQASRWSETTDGDGYIYSFCGPHSLFSDTIRSLRVLAVAHQLGHRLLGENDTAFSLLDRLVEHHSLKLIGLEGAAGEVSNPLLANFPRKDVKKTVSLSFMRQGKLNGAEYLAANSDHELKLYGVEDITLYFENMETSSCKHEVLK